MEEVIKNLNFINDELVREKNNLRKKIYEKIIDIKDYKFLDQNEHFLFQKYKQICDNEDKEIIDKYMNLNIISSTIKTYSKKIFD